MARQRKPYARHMDFAWSLVLTPPILLFPLALGALFDPSVILEDWDLYLLFFGLPWAFAIAIWWYVRQERRAAELGDSAPSPRQIRDAAGPPR